MAIQTATGSTCQATSPHRGANPGHELEVLSWGGRRYTVCAHPVGTAYCGRLIDVTDLPAVVCCCGDHPNDATVPAGIAGRSA